MTDRAILFNNEHDRHISLSCLRGSLFGQENHTAELDEQATIALPRDITDAQAQNLLDDINNPARLFIPLTAEEIDLIASDEFATHPVVGDFSAETISPADHAKIAKRRAEIENNIAVEKANLEAAQFEPGGVPIPDGFALVGKVSYDDETTRIELEDLLPICMIEETPGVSASLQRPQYGSPQGFVTLRIIHDAAGVAYLFRKDEGGRSYFKTAFGHGALA
jgi:hypothetical protein